jgi:hypothetical protein
MRRDGARYKPSPDAGSVTRPTTQSFPPPLVASAVSADWGGLAEHSKCAKRLECGSSLPLSRTSAGGVTNTKVGRRECAL